MKCSRLNEKIEITKKVWTLILIEFAGGLVLPEHEPLQGSPPRRQTPSWSSSRGPTGYPDRPETKDIAKSENFV